MWASSEPTRTQACMGVPGTRGCPRPAQGTPPCVSTPTGKPSAWRHGYPRYPLYPRLALLMPVRSCARMPFWTTARRPLQARWAGAFSLLPRAGARPARRAPRQAPPRRTPDGPVSSSPRPPARRRERGAGVASGRPFRPSPGLARWGERCCTARSSGSVGTTAGAWAWGRTWHSPCGRLRRYGTGELAWVLRVHIQDGVPFLDSARRL